MVLTIQDKKIWIYLVQRKGHDMKDKFFYKAIPTIVGERFCIFEVQILAKFFFWKKRIYSGYIIVNRKMETCISRADFVDPKAYNDDLSRLKAASQRQAEFIFKAYDMETESKHKGKHEYMYESQNRA